LKLTSQTPGPFHKPAARPFRTLLTLGAGLMTLATGCVSEKDRNASDEVIRHRLDLRENHLLTPRGRVDSASVSQMPGEFDRCVMNVLTSEVKNDKPLEAYRDWQLDTSRGRRSSFSKDSAYREDAAAQLLRILKSPQLKKAILTQQDGKKALRAALKNPLVEDSTKRAIREFLANSPTDSSDAVRLFCCEEERLMPRKYAKPSYEYETPGSPYVHQPGEAEKAVDAARRELGL
jgi:hypothetical protein